MKIAIIGGGISGLTTYLQLQKHFSQSPKLTDTLDISIFEHRDLKKHDYDIQAAGVPSIGGGYGLAANGMKSLRRLNPDIHAKILSTSFPTPRFQMKTRQGWTLGAINCVIEDPDGGEAECCCMVTREVVLEALYECVPDGVISIRKVVEVVDGEDAAVVRFGDGGEEMSFDLVVGADGIWSRARRAISGEKNGPEYRGLATLGGFIETKHLSPSPPTSGPMPYPQSQVIMTFGHNGFLGYTPCTTAGNNGNTTSSNTGHNTITPDQIRGKTAIPRGSMAFWWARSAHPDPKMEPNVEKTKQDLLKRMSSWKDPNVRSILQHSQRTAMIATYALPKQETWAGKRVVLVGDAAHALPTSSGQGVSQSVEDAEALAMLLAHNLSSHEAGNTASTSAALQKTFQQYTAVRKAHVERILDAGNRGGDSSRDMNLVAEYTMYAFFWVMLKCFSRLFTKEIETYDVVKEVEKIIQE